MHLPIAAIPQAGGSLNPWGHPSGQGSLGDRSGCNERHDGSIFPQMPHWHAIVSIRKQ